MTRAVCSPRGGGGGGVASGVEWRLLSWRGVSRGSCGDKTSDWRPHLPVRIRAALEKTTVASARTPPALTTRRWWAQEGEYPDRFPLSPPFHSATRQVAVGLPRRPPRGRPPPPRRRRPPNSCSRAAAAGTTRRRERPAAAAAPLAAATPPSVTPPSRLPPRYGSHCARYRDDPRGRGQRHRCRRQRRRWLDGSR